MGYCEITGYNLEQPKNTLVAANDEETIEVVKIKPPAQKSNKKSRPASQKYPLTRSVKRQKVSGGKSIEKIRKLNATHWDGFESVDDLSDDTIISLSAMNQENEPVLSQIQSSPLQWSVDDVVLFLNQNGFEGFSEKFVENQITGEKLFEMTREDVFELVGKKLGPSLNIFNKIGELKNSYEMKKNSK